MYANIAALNQAMEQTTPASAILRSVARDPAAQATAAADWQHFLASDLGFTYAAVTNADEPAYRNFLHSRYQTISISNQAYQLTGALRLRVSPISTTSSGTRPSHAGCPLAACSCRIGSCSRRWSADAAECLSLQRGRSCAAQRRLNTQTQRRRWRSASRKTKNRRTPILTSSSIGRSSARARRG